MVQQRLPDQWYRVVAPLATVRSAVQCCWGDRVRVYSGATWNIPVAIAVLKNQFAASAEGTYPCTATGTYSLVSGSNSLNLSTWPSMCSGLALSSVAYRQVGNGVTLALSGVINGQPFTATTALVEGSVINSLKGSSSDLNSIVNALPIVIVAVGITAAAVFRHFDVAQNSRLIFAPLASGVRMSLFVLWLCVCVLVFLCVSVLVCAILSRRSSTSCRQ